MIPFIEVLPLKLREENIAGYEMFHCLGFFLALRCEERELPYRLPIACATAV